MLRACEMRGIRAAVLAAAVALAATTAPMVAQGAQAVRPSSAADAQYERGARALRQGDIPAALEHLGAAVREAPNDAGVVAAYAQALIADGRPDEARRMLDGLAAGARSGEEDLAVGVARYQLGDWSAAAESLRRSVAREPRNALAHLYLASALVELGELDEAERHLADAERLDPALAADVAYRRGQLALARGDRAAAERYFADVERIAPDSTLARAARRQRGGPSPERPWTVYATLGGGYDSNVNLSGQDAVLSTDREDDWLGFAELGADYLVVDRDRASVRVGATAYIDYHEDERDFDLLTGQLWTVAAFELREDLIVDARYTYEYIWTDFERFRQTHAAEPSLRWRAREDLLSRLFVRFEHRDFYRPTEAFPTFALPPPADVTTGDDPLDRDGDVWLPGIEQYWFFPDATGWGRGFLRLGYRYREELTDGTEADAHGHIANAMLGLPLPADVFFLAEGEYEWRHYDDPSVIGLLTREQFGDREERITRARVLLRRPLTEHVTAEIGYRYAFWGSNVDFYEFTRHNGYFLVTYRY